MKLYEIVEGLSRFVTFLRVHSWTCGLIMKGDISFLELLFYTFHAFAIVIVIRLCRLSPLTFLNKMYVVYFSLDFAFSLYMTYHLFSIINAFNRQGYSYDPEAI